MLNVIDEFKRECLANDVGRLITVDDVVDRLVALVKERGAPRYLRMDKGSAFVAPATNDWCRFNESGSLSIEPGSPWQNGWIELFNARLRDEFLNGQPFDSLIEAKVLFDGWRHDTKARTNARRHRTKDSGVLCRDLEVQEPADTRTSDLENGVLLDSREYGQNPRGINPGLGTCRFAQWSFAPRGFLRRQVRRLVLIAILMRLDIGEQ